MRCTLAIVAVAVFVSSPASAQAPPSPAAQVHETGQAPPPEPLRLKENVEVTATRGAVGAKTSPASSTVLLRSDLEKRDVVTVDQATHDDRGAQLAI